jgi:hypothetical protein
MNKTSDFCILRLQKIKSITSLKGSFKHSFREQKTPNADSKKSHMNINMEALNSTDAMALFKRKLPNKIRKNGVVAIEHVITASPNFFKGKNKVDINEYFSKSIVFFNKYWGDENVISANIHYDETTPHMHLFVCPIDKGTGRLNCRKWLGERDSLSKLQSQFYDEVGAPSGLRRGVEGSKLNNQKLKDYYKKISAIESMEPPVKPSKYDYIKASTGMIPSAILNINKSAELSYAAANKIKELISEKESLMRFISKSVIDNEAILGLKKNLLQVNNELNDESLKSQAKCIELERLQNLISRQKSTIKSEQEPIENDTLDFDIEKEKQHEIY